AMASHALAFYAQREREVYASCQHHARVFFREAAAFHRTTFWDARSGPETREAAGPDPVEADSLERLEAARGEVAGAYDRLRRHHRLRLRLSDAVKFAPAPEINGCEVVLREAMVMPGDRKATRFAAGVNLPELSRIASACHDVPGILSEYEARVGPAAPDNV